jgi:hypothetical protein
MKKLKNPFLKFAYLAYLWLQPLWDPLKTGRAVLKYPAFIKSLINYRKLSGSESVGILNTQPCLGESTKTSPFDAHYFYQDIWAASRIFESKTEKHIDVGSKIDFVGFLSAFTKVKFIDIRPIKTDLENFESAGGDILSLPFSDNSIYSLSCLHVAEHIGLGRYGDALDAQGTQKACGELSRVLAKGGNLYFSLPIGKPKLVFNAHRIHSTGQIFEYFKNLKLVEFSGIDDNGNFRRNIDINSLNGQDYACGLFWFKKV